MSKFKVSTQRLGDVFSLQNVGSKSFDHDHGHCMVSQIFTVTYLLQNSDGMSCPGEEKGSIYTQPTPS